MRKDRNTFIQESGMYNVGYSPNQMPNQNMMPYGQGASYNSYYVGPNDPSNIENRIMKMERQIHQLETRVSRLESSNTTIEEIDNNSNMYII